MTHHPGPWGSPKPSDLVFLGLSLLAALAVTGLGWLLADGPVR